MAHEGLRPSGWGKGEFPEETWPPLKLLFLVLGNLDSCKQEGGSAVWETCTEYHCTPTKVFLKFSQSLRRPPTVATWLKGQSTDWLKHRAQSGVKRCTCINLLVGFSGKGLGHSLKPVETNDVSCAAPL